MSFTQDIDHVSCSGDAQRLPKCINTNLVSVTKSLNISFLAQRKCWKHTWNMEMLLMLYRQVQTPQNISVAK